MLRFSFLVLLLFCFCILHLFFFFSSRRRHTRSTRDWSSDVCSSDLGLGAPRRRHGVAHEPLLRAGARLARDRDVRPVRPRLGAPRLVGNCRSAPRTGQPGRGRLRPHRHLFLFRQRDGQTGPVAEPDHPGAVAPVRRLRARAGAAPSAGENVGGRPVTARTKGLVVAALHIALVSALGAKLLADRAALPRVWVEVAPYDPNLPIRGRYVRLQVKAEARGFDEPAGSAASAWGYARLSVEGDRLVATRTDDGG